MIFIDIMVAAAITAGETAGLSARLDDRFHETGLDEAGLHGTGIMFVDSSFEKS